MSALVSSAADAAVEKAEEFANNSLVVVVLATKQNAVLFDLVRQV